MALYLKNALSYLYTRNEIPTEIIKKIYVFTLDIIDSDGNIGHGTSKEAIIKFVTWLNDNAKRKNFNILCERLTGNDVTIQKLKNCITNGGCVVARCWQGSEHYVLITSIDEINVYLFDPYYLKRTALDNDCEVKMVFNRPLLHNRIVTLKRLFEETKNDFALGEIDKRECILFNKSS